jgi:hypothetical protein
MAIDFKIDSIDEAKVIAFPAGVNYIHTQISLAPGATEYRALSALERFPVFAVQFDPIVRGELADPGARILWDSLLISAKGTWWTVVVIENQSTVPVSVILKSTDV